VARGSRVTTHGQDGRATQPVETPQRGVSTQRRGLCTLKQPIAAEFKDKSALPRYFSNSNSSMQG